MLSLDLSRDSFQRPKNFTGMRWQQGRIPLDSEMNEGADIAAEELRRAIRDVICASGTPDDGFRVSAPRVTDGAIDFDIARGTYYIGGLRYDMLAPARFLAQPDWLQLPLDLAPLPAPPQGGTRSDFVYLEGWEQDVSATEDAELFERALGSGADGAGRRRRLARVHLVPGSADTCAQALADVRGALQTDPVTGALVSGAGLTVGFTDEGLEENLCAPQTQGGYLGAENESFRVQLTAPDRFIWGRDNAAPLYRVQLAPVDPPADAPPGTPAQTRVTFLTRPRDAVSQPLAGQAVELMRWTTRLPDGEKLAEPIGTLATVATDYSPEEGTLLIDHVLDPGWTDWFTGAGAGSENPLDDPDMATYFYLRVWSGGSGEAGAPDHLITPGPIALGTTGLEVSFAPALAPGSFGVAGEFWVVAARPNAPDVVTPWRLLEPGAETPPPAPPMGPLRHLAALGIISWTAVAGGAVQATVSDCRERFRKLCMQPTCCEVTVGDGMRSHGDVNSIAEALARLPASGGKICLLRGRHTASVEITGRSDIRISGCGPETLWLADESQDDFPAALRLTGCARITLSDFEMEAEAGDAVLIGAREGESAEEARCTDVTLRNLALRGRDASVLWLNGCDGLTLEHCRITQRELTAARTEDTAAGTDPAVFALGDGLTVERCEVTVDLAIPAERRPLGGITIGGTSTHVALRENRITGGKGHGITLGHIEWVAQDGGFTGVWTFGGGFTVTPAGCLVPGWYPIPPRLTIDIPERLDPVSGGEIRDIDIAGNLIADMGLSGISVAHFFDLETAPDFITVARARIRDNEITRCLRTDLDTPPLALRYFMGHGGIALAACELIEIAGNRIHANATDLAAPNCGIFLLLASGAVIRDNRIHDNGARAARGTVLDPGRRGGVNIGWCVTYAGEDTDADAAAAPPRMAALEMSGNFVDSGHGPALKLVALGPVRVCDNRLVGAGTSAPELALLGFRLSLDASMSGLLGVIAALIALDPVVRRDFAEDSLALTELFIAALGGNAVSIFNLAFLEELTGGLDDGPQEQSPLAVGGETMFDANQVSFRPHGLEAASSVSSVLVASLDDVSVSNNQLECETGFDMVLTNAFALGASVRMLGNRLQEQLGRTLFSGYTHGLLLNTTAMNQGTHCFAITTLGTPSTLNRVAAANLSLIDQFALGDNRFCPLLLDYLDDIGGGDGQGDITITNDFVSIPGGGHTAYPGRSSWGRMSYTTTMRRA
ncbi:right-handed parallel beta-helix repeat-containing protein [Oceanicella sp. SM1341]|uniref:right-handed parallel beta-helix repeat-containing protein n=1 Tax=Oceanicella sp. SM1341 TaxID=1548889 RepID=UPI000E4FA819|nr:right-handed parallel beta-helix repeat-containing protein [Oceanicella sp. SM1341]